MNRIGVNMIKNHHNPKIIVITDNNSIIIFGNIVNLERTNTTGPENNTVKKIIDAINAKLAIKFRHLHRKSSNLLLVLEPKTHHRQRNYLLNLHHLLLT